MAYAASELSMMWKRDCGEPRSTCSHCGSENALDHRVPALPSTALPGGVPAFSALEEVAFLPNATFVVPQPPPLPEVTVQLNDVNPVAPVVSRAVTVTFDVPAVVGVPEISPDEALMDSPAGRPVAL